MQRLILSLSLAFCLAPAAYADVVYYKSGESLKGLVVEEHHDRVIVSTEAGEWTILKRDMQEIFYDDPERNYLFMGNQALEEGNFGLARMFYRRALQIKPEFREAQDALNRLADMKNKAELMQPVGDPTEALLQQWGLTLEINKNLPEVKGVRKDSLADRSGIEPGDFIVSSWGYSLAFMGAEQVAGILLGPAATSVQITIQRRVVFPRKSLWGWPGITLDMEPQGLTVKQIKPDGPAAASGLRLLDRILELNSLSTRYMPLGEARKILNGTKTEAVFLIHRDLLVKRE
ncbi:MAG: PDZ domain-containing protein [Candidatus Omnitrophica bacterium]|nr:PDZ domain-containing protein [Candidatus Omnitrophota bacterium]